MHNRNRHYLLRIKYREHVRKIFFCKIWLLAYLQGVNKQSNWPIVFGAVTERLWHRSCDKKSSLIQASVLR